MERHLLSLTPLDPHEKPCNILLHIKDIGSWVVKLRHQSVIYNRKELILASSLQIVTTILFRDISAFQQVMSKVTTLDTEIKNGLVGMRECHSSFILAQEKDIFNVCFNHDKHRHLWRPTDC